MVMSRTATLESRIEALSTELSGLLDEYLEVRERVRDLEAATEGATVDGDLSSVLPERDGGTAWPAVADGDASSDSDEEAVGDSTDWPDEHAAGDRAPASQAAVAAAVEAVERADAGCDANDEPEKGDEHTDEDIIVG